MNYRIVHRTAYRYAAPVSRARNEAHLRPRDSHRQHCLSSELVVEPTPTSWSERTDFFGNPVASFAVDGPFSELTVTSTSSVAVSGRQPLAGGRLGLGAGPGHARPDLRAETLAAREFCFESPLVPLSDKVRRSYAAPSFRPGAR